MRILAGWFALAIALAPVAARADGEIVIEIKGAPAPRETPVPSSTGPREQPVQSQPREEPPANAPRQHVAVARRGGKALALPPVQKQVTYGQLARALTAQTPLFRKPDARSQVLSKAEANQYLVVQKPVGAWFAVLMSDGSTGYVPATHVELLNYKVTEVRGGRPGYPYPTVSGPGLGRAIVEEAYRYLGTRYVWGGNDERGIDCSGLVKRCYGSCGIPLPRTASEQAYVGTPIDFRDLQTGDRLYFSVKRAFDHTGIYIGDGYFIHSAHGAGGVVVSHLSERLYARSLSAARR
jgi:hypothetical protein